MADLGKGRFGKISLHKTTNDTFSRIFGQFIYDGVILRFVIYIKAIRPCWY
jgi:hypothetical protein